MPGRAAEPCLRAARKARSLNAFAEAWGHYQRAATGGGRRPRLALEAAGTARLAGDPAAAATLLEEALTDRPGTDHAGALERLGCFLWEAGRTTQSLAAYAAAADALGSDVTAVHAQVWGAQARAALIMAQFDEAVKLADQAIEAARRHGRPPSSPTR